jgi:hypothetical protein
MFRAYLIVLTVAVATILGITIYMHVNDMMYHPWVSYAMNVFFIGWLIVLWYKTWKFKIK